MRRSTARRSGGAERAVALVSGGLDSTVSLAAAAQRVEVVAAVTVRYGQRAETEEVKAARRIAKALGVRHRVISLPWLGRLGTGALLDPSSTVPTVRASDLTAGRAREASKAVWVPNRNGLLVNVAACLAEAWGAGVVVAGFNREEAAHFPDNGPEFVRAVNRALRWSTSNAIRVVSYVQDMTKREMVETGSRLGAPLDALYSCYVGGPLHCGRCESCVRLAQAFRAAGKWRVLQHRFAR